jgi:hypothetical protein
MVRKYYFDFVKSKYQINKKSKKLVLQFSVQMKMIRKDDGFLCSVFANSLSNFHSQFQLYLNRFLSLKVVHKMRVSYAMMVELDL